MMQTLVNASEGGYAAARENPPDAAAVDAVLTASRSLIAVATRRRALIEEILAMLPEDAQRAVAEALRAFSDAAGEVPDSQWPPPGPAGEAARPPVPAHPVRADERTRP